MIVQWELCLIGKSLGYYKNYLLGDQNSFDSWTRRGSHIDQQLLPIKIMIACSNNKNPIIFQQIPPLGMEKGATAQQLFMEKNPPEYIIVPAKPEEVKFFQDIQHKLHWDPLINSYLTLPEINPDGILLGKIGGEIVSCILALRHSKKFGFIAVYWVKKEFRGRGYGVQIFTQALQVLKDCQTIGLDSVPEQIPNYSKWGFTEYCNATKCYVNGYKAQTKHRNTKISKNYKDVNFNRILEFDSKVFPGQQRAKFLMKSFETGQVFISTKDEQVQGYAIVCQCASGLALSPMYVLNQLAAEDLINQIFEHYKHTKKHIMAFVFDEYKKISDFMKKKFNLPGYNCKRMYLRMPHFNKDFDRSCVYSFNSYERG